MINAKIDFNQSLGDFLIHKATINAKATKLLQQKLVKQDEKMAFSQQSTNKPPGVLSYNPILSKEHQANMVDLN